mmetsp:Transcript_8804/g.54091  ORF Transcript_8804/g.54091 Transcript_8804/m.54091 type:complete len:234 (-) Transcript_8804:5717-6418(-)
MPRGIGWEWILWLGWLPGMHTWQGTSTCAHTWEGAVQQCCSLGLCVADVPHPTSTCTYTCAEWQPHCASKCGFMADATKLDGERRRQLEEVETNPSQNYTFAATLEFASGGRSKRPYCAVKCSNLGYNVTQDNLMFRFSPLGSTWEDCACVSFEGKQIERNLILAEEDDLVIRVASAGSQVYLQFVDAGFTFTNVIEGELLGVSSNAAGKQLALSAVNWMACILLLGPASHLI